MKIAHANVRSMNTSFGLIENTIINEKIDVFGLTEIWHPSVSMQESLKRRWTWISTQRDNKRGGGAALIISKGTKTMERKDLYNKKVEAVWCNLYGENFKCVVGSVYIPPNDSEMMKIFLSTVEKVAAEDVPLILIGDFNAHHKYWGGCK